MIEILGYGGIAVIVILLLIFEIREGRLGQRTPRSNGYEYYTASGTRLRIRHMFGSLYRIYVFDPCPVETRQDRLGTYFTIRAGSASEAEYIVDGIYQGGGGTSF